MSRRREANRAEAIVRGGGAIIMLVVLLGMVNGAPAFLRGKNPSEAIATLLSTLMLFAGLLGAITIIGLVVWFKVMKGPRNPVTNTGNSQYFYGPSPSPALRCADCGTSITAGIANYCQKRTSIFDGKSICMPCQARYRP